MSAEKKGKTMRRMANIRLAAIVCLSTRCWCNDISVILGQARTAFGRCPCQVVVLAERKGGDWSIAGLDVYGTSLDDGTLKQIGSVETLERLALHGIRLATKAGWTHIARLDRLRHLKLLSEVRDLEVQPLTALRDLQSLDLVDCTGLTNATFVQLSRFPRLARCLLPYVQIDMASLAEVVKLKHLEMLSLTATDDAMSHLLHALNVRSLGIYDLGPKGLAFLPHLTGLRQLNVARYSSMQGMLDLSACAGVNWLILGYGFADKVGLVRLPVALRRLELEGWLFSGVEPDGLHLAEPIPIGLESVRIRMPQDKDVEGIQTPSFAWLAALPALRELVLEMPGGPVKEKVASICRLRGLRSVKVIGACPIVCDEDIERLAALPELECLAIEAAGISVTDAGLGALKRANGLRRLELNVDLSKCTAAGLSSLWDLSGLEALGIHYLEERNGCQAETALKGIGALRNLKELSLGGEVTDNMLQSLTKLRKLRRLDLSAAKHVFTDQGLAQTVAALPDLKVLVWSFPVLRDREPNDRK